MQTGPKKTTALALTCALAGLTTGCPTHETDTVHKLDQIENRANRLTNEAACLELQRALALTGIDPAPDQNPEHKYTAEVSHGSHTGECSLQVWQKKNPIHPRKKCRIPPNA